jgi:hypothetical protein
MRTYAPYFEIPIAINSNGGYPGSGTTYDLWMRLRKRNSGDYDCHAAFLRPLASASAIGADDSGGAGYQLITLEDAHDYTNGDQIHFEQGAAATAGYGVDFTADQGTATSTAAELTDTAANGGSGWTTDALIGRRIYNVTTSNSAVITDNDNTSITSGISGGWTTGDLYYIGGYIISSINAAAGTFEIQNTGLGAVSDASDSYCFGEPELLGFNAPQNAVKTIYEWHNDSRTVYISHTGTYYLRIYAMDTLYKADKITLVPQGESITTTELDTGTASSDGDDHAFGYDQSEYSAGAGGSSEDNEDNWPTLPYPLPSTTVNISTKTPANSSTNQTTTTTVRADFTDMSNLQINKFQVFNQSGDALAGTAQQGENWCEFFPAVPLTNNKTYTVSLTGRITDSDDTVKSISSGTWGFTTIDTGAAGTLFSQNFTGLVASVPHAITSSEAEDYFSDSSVTTTKGLVSPVGFDAQKAWIVEDPFNTGRGHVLRIDALEGFWGLGRSDIYPDEPSTVQAFIRYSDTPTEEDLYLAYDIAVDNNFIFPKAIKFTGLFTNTGGSPDIFGDYASASPVVWGGGVPYDDEIMSIYYYNLTRNAHQYALTNPATSGTSIYSSPAAGYNSIYFTRNVWHRVEVRATMNTVVGSTAQGDGKLQVWWDGVQVYSNESWNWKDDTEDLKWQFAKLQTFYGGSGQDWAAPRNQSMYYDNIIISTSPITHT